MDCNSCGERLKRFLKGQKRHPGSIGLPRHVRHSLDIHSRQKVNLLKMTELVRRFFRCHL
jgi:hypothetical protein